MLDNVKLTTNIEYRFPISKIVEGALFTDAGNIWSLKTQESVMSSSSTGFISN